MASNAEAVGERVAEALANGTTVRVLSGRNTWSEISRVRGGGGVVAHTMGRGWVPWGAVRGVHFGGTPEAARELEELGAR